VVSRASRGLRREEAGFSLVEVLVSAMMMFGVLFAMYAIFDVSVRAFGYGGDRLEALESARLALGRMEREIRAAYPYDLTSTPPKRYLFLNPSDPTKPAVPTATRIAFGNETGRPPHQRLRGHRLLPQRPRSEAVQGQQRPDARRFRLG
jgi:type II secretory pathway component PulJ